MRCNILFYTELGYFTLNKAIKCVSYRLSTPRLNFLSSVFGQCTLEFRKCGVGGGGSGGGENGGDEGGAGVTSPPSPKSPYGHHMCG